MDWRPITYKSPDTHLKFSWLVCLKTRFFTAPATIKIAFDGPTPPGVDGVVSYSTAIRLNFRFRRVFGLIIRSFTLIYEFL